MKEYLEKQRTSQHKYAKINEKVTWQNPSRSSIDLRIVWSCHLAEPRKVVSFACSRCNAALPYEEVYLVNTGKKIKVRDSAERTYLAVCCKACATIEK